MSGRTGTSLEPQIANGYTSQTSGKVHFKNKDIRTSGKQWEQPSSFSSRSQVRGKYRKESGRHPNGSGRHVTAQRPRLSTGSDLSDVEYIEKELSLSERKKSGSISLNHLLNFTLTPRERSGVDYISDHSEHFHKKGKKHQHSNFNKEQFLQANCQFIVRERSIDYSIHCVDPDLLVDWDSIEQVRLLCDNIPSCPICLYPPSSAKITRCGHVYCFSCILHYLSLSDKEWRKCPICFESVYKKSLKSVTTLSAKHYEEGQLITMRLMKRNKNCTLVLPKSDWTTEKSSQLISMEDEEHCQYSKILSASPYQIRTKIIDVERRNLKEQLSLITSQNESERCFIESALHDLKEREKKIESLEEVVNETTTIEGTFQDDQATPSTPPIISYHESYITGDYEPAFSDTEDSPTDKGPIDLGALQNSNSEFEDDSSNDNSFASSSPSEFVYFYQSIDGQHIYLHPINTKCILKEYGGVWENCPDTVTAQIIESDHYSMTKDERVRYRFLNHLPLTCQFTLCELDIKSPIVSPHTLQLFSEQLSKRRNKRQKKRREDKRREKKADRNSPIDVSTSTNSTDINPEDLHNFLSVASSPPLPSPLKPVNSALPIDSTPIRANGVPSFAQALLSGEKRVSSKPHPSVTAGSPRVPTHSVNSPRARIHKDTVDCNGEENHSVPSYAEAFTNGFADALLTATVKAAVQSPDGRPGGSKTAKKGRKKLVLFSTGGQHKL